MLRIKMPLYDCQVIVYFTSEMHKLPVMRKYRIPVEEGQNYGLTLRTGDIKLYYIAFDKKDLCINTIVHEVTHISEALFEDRDIPFSGEPLAYLIGYLAEVVYNYAKKKELL